MWTVTETFGHCSIVEGLLPCLGLQCPWAWGYHFIPKPSAQPHSQRWSSMIQNRLCVGAGLKKIATIRVLRDICPPAVFYTELKARRIPDVHQLPCLLWLSVFTPGWTELSATAVLQEYPWTSHLFLSVLWKLASKQGKHIRRWPLSPCLAGQGQVWERGLADLKSKTLRTVEK